MKDIQDMAFMTPVVYLYEGQRKHGRLIEANSEWALVNTSSRTGIRRVRTADVWPDMDRIRRGEHPGDHDPERTPDTEEDSHD